MPTTTIPTHHMQMANKWRTKKDCGFQGYGPFSGRGCVCWISLVLILVLVPDFILALKDVSVMIPQAVKRGSNALFTCNYDMENDTLYSVKWYKGKREFYRYTPKENSAMKVFAMTSGLNVERNLSNQSHVVLQSVPLNISGKFTWEISVEAPTFQTAMVSGEMEVVELPEEHTVVTGIQARYRIGDLVDGNCSIKYSKPAANLTWTINGIVVPPHHIKTYQTERREPRPNYGLGRREPRAVICAGRESCCARAAYSVHTTTRSPTRSIGKDRIWPPSPGSPAPITV
nr:uncharacterized protein LOC118879638 [Drosophila suzukii]